MQSSKLEYFAQNFTVMKVLKSTRDSELYQQMERSLIDVMNLIVLVSQVCLVFCRSNSPGALQICDFCCWRQVSGKSCFPLQCSQAMMNKAWLLQYHNEMIVATQTITSCQMLPGVGREGGNIFGSCIQEKVPQLIVLVNSTICDK